MQAATPLGHGHRSPLMTAHETQDQEGAPRKPLPSPTLRAVLPPGTLNTIIRINIIKPCIPPAAPLYAASAKSCLPTTCCATPFFHVRPVLLKHTLIPPKRLIVQLAL